MSTLIARATHTDHCGNVHTLSVWKQPTGKHTVALVNSKGVVKHLSAAYCGFHDKGTAGAKQEVKATALQAKTSAALARKLSMMGFRWEPVAIIK